MSVGTPPDESPGLIARMLATNRWDGEAAGAWVLLSGGSVDRFPPLMTSLIQPPGTATMTAETDLPLLLPWARLPLAAEVCAGLNRRLVGGTVSITTIGRPALTSKRFVSEDEETAISQMTNLVLGNRAVARSLIGAFKRVAEGISAPDLLHEVGCPALETEARTAARLALNGGLTPTAEGRDTAATTLLGAHGVTDLEVEGLARLDTFVRQQHNTNHPFCAGPIVLHADGVAECYGCELPLERRHLGGTS